MYIKSTCTIFKFHSQPCWIFFENFHIIVLLKNIRFRKLKWLNILATIDETPISFCTYMNTKWIRIAYKIYIWTESTRNILINHPIIHRMAGAIHTNFTCLTKCTNKSTSTCKSWLVDGVYQQSLFEQNLYRYIAYRNTIDNNPAAHNMCLYRTLCILATMWTWPCKCRVMLIRF